MSSSTTTAPSSGGGSSHQSIPTILSPVRYEGPNFLPSVSTSQHSQAPYEPPTLPPLPYSLHRERLVSTPTRNLSSLSNSETIIEKEPSSSNSNTTLLPSVSSAPELLNNEVI